MLTFWNRYQTKVKLYENQVVRSYATQIRTTYLDDLFVTRFRVLRSLKIIKNHLKIQICSKNPKTLLLSSKHQCLLFFFKSKLRLNKRIFSMMLRKKISNSNNRSLFFIGFFNFISLPISISITPPFTLLKLKTVTYLELRVVDFSSTIDKIQFRMFALSSKLWLRTLWANIIAN